MYSSCPLAARIFINNIFNTRFMEVAAAWLIVFLKQCATFGQRLLKTLAPKWITAYICIYVYACIQIKSGVLYHVDQKSTSLLRRSLMKKDDEEDETVFNYAEFVSSSSSRWNVKTEDVLYITSSGLQLVVFM